MKAQERLHAAHLAAREGRHEEALAEYVWFHEHALQEQPSLYGVRLSFALSYWVELSKDHPPALQALRDIRDRKARTLESGNPDRELFHDVEAINQYLGQSGDTARLFQLLERQNPAFAGRCASLAMEALAEAGQFELASKYLPEPVPHITKLAAHLSDDVARIPDRPRSKAPRYRAFTWNFAQYLRLFMSVLSGAGRQSEALACREAAFSTMKPWYVRRAVERALAGDA